jgi:calcineurin-like phosphoesterase family protein
MLNNKLKKPLIGLVIVILVTLLSFNSIKTNSNYNLYMQKFNYSGTNSLFIEYDKGLTLHWITNNADIGFYELLADDNSVISKGETTSGRTHSIAIDYEIKEIVTFRFGVKNGSAHKVILRPKSHLKKAIFKNIDSLYVIGDVHGRYDELINLLKKSNIIDEKLNWIAGSSNVVFLGDLFDRGNDVTKVLWFIYELEDKAEIAGGKVHLVLGNHEIMTMTKDLRYLSRKEASIPIAHGVTYDYMFHPIKSFLGSWLRSKPSIIKIDNALFAHGGIVDLANKSIDEYNHLVNTYMKEPMFLDIMKEQADSIKYNAEKWYEMKYFFYNEDSPFWYRGYVYYDTLGPQLNSMLKKFDSKIHVVAHTPLETITQRYNGKLLTTDLNEAATQLLLLVKKRNKYLKFKIDSSGKISELP